MDDGDRRKGFVEEVCRLDAEAPLDAVPFEAEFEFDDADSFEADPLETEKSDARTVFDSTE